MNVQSVKQRFGIIGRSEILERALNTAIRVASTDLTVLIQGKSGVGKEIFSRIIHELGKRKHNKFIAINCGAIPGGTINSELFGHEKGAFTGAATERKGYFETVNEGTIFLDEVGEMPLDTQAYLLRILESGEFIRVGSSKVMRTNVRVIAATNVSLEDRIKKGKFREDLFYRLNTVPIRVPALHERKEDIYMLFRKFAVDFSEKYRSESVELTNAARTILENYRWPGNVRELKNAVEQLSVLADSPILDNAKLIELVPKLLSRNLPAKVDIGSETSYEEREILFKFLYDMKRDLNDMKSLIYELVKTNDLAMPNIDTIKSLTPTEPYQFDGPRKTTVESSTYVPSPGFDESPQIVLNPNATDQYQKGEEVEENLSLENMEKDFIERALKKHRGRRKDAALDLGISERTLYRKIKQYEIDE